MATIPTIKKLRTHVPPLPPDKLELALQEVDRLAVSLSAREQIKQILKAAANENSETVEAVIASLPKDRQQIVIDLLLKLQQQEQQHTSAAAILAAGLTLLSLASFLAALVAQFQVTADEIELRTDMLLRERVNIWIKAITDEARACGCDRSGVAPSGADLEALRSMSEKAAQSVADTYNRDVQRQLNKLTKAVPDGDKDYYLRELRKWAANRSVWKSAQIALNTETQTREYARRRFWEMNKLTERKFIATGVTPTCKICVRIFAAGVVGWDYVRRNPLPAHINCPHYYKLVHKPKVDCKTLWVG